ncbi:DUF6250 domain-containing protein [Bacteroides sp.]
MKGIIIRYFALFTFVWLISACFSSSRNNTPVLEKWVAEDESAAMQLSLISDTLDIVAPAGLTLWYNEFLTGNYEINYRIAMLMQSGEYDRLSDLNCFWAASDPLYPDNIFARSAWRNGVFKNYNTLNLFYVGYGGNDNTTTRFRRYYAEYYGVDEDRVKPLIAEYTDRSHLLMPDKWYHIVIRVERGVTTYSVDGEELFRASLHPGEGDGYFGLRLLQNHVRMTGFQVKPI